jgi:diguanylate cyclase (GGDEF)-like protein
VHSVLLSGRRGLLVGPAAAACYLLQVTLGSGVVPPVVAALRVAVLLALGFALFAAGRAYRIAHRRADRGRALAEAAVEDLAFAATHDALTGLPNRRRFLHDVEASLLTGAAAPGRAVLLLDVDRFKTVNDSLGHHAGDELLLDVSERLSSGLRGASVARLGGDEFAVLQSGPDPVDVTTVAEAVRGLFAEPFIVAGREHSVTVSVGVAPIGLSPVAAEELLRHADVAMYAAKGAGRDRVAVYDATMADRAERLMSLEQNLRGAVRRAEVGLVFQPITDLGTGRVLAVEALARWAPGGRPVGPDVFVPLAEETGLIGALGAQVLDGALGALARWRATGPGVDYVAVNVSPLQLRDPTFTSTVRDTLTSHGLCAADLVLEITEGAVVDSTPAVIDTLGSLRDLGVRIAIDDFGTGHSSLARLRHLPVSELKVDRTFVAELEHDDRVTRIVLDLARGLGLRTVAEGVETEAQLAALRVLGCDAAQGYLLGRPVPEAELGRALAALV